jgi:hypothetical protein
MRSVFIGRATLSSFWLGVPVIRNAYLMAVLTGIALLTSTQDAYAYLDPGTASLILQGIIGGIAAGAAVVAAYWQRAKYFFSRTFGRSGDDRLAAAKTDDE